MSLRPQQPAPATPAPGKLAITELAALKARRQPIVMVTAYDAPGGRLADEAGADLVLVGDSAAMTVLGHPSTVPATMEEMLVLTTAVTRGARRPLVIADMPFGSFQVSDEDALRNAIRFVKEAGADAVKLEGAGPMLSRVRAIVGAGIPVMGHIGLTPQSATALGGFKAQGRSAEKALALLADARALEAAGCFSLVLEAVPAPVAEMDAAVRATIDNLQTSAARVSVERAEVSNNRLVAEIRVENLTGHKLPTGYPSRRAWLHLTVRDRNGRVVFESGAIEPRGSIAGNDNDANAREVEPHYAGISEPDQVQIYESVMRDSSGTPTTGR